MKIIRKQLSVNEVLPPLTRYDDDTDTVQTFDGTDWIDTPERDPRNNNSYPPPDTSDPRCDGAARMSAFLQEIVSGIIAGVDDNKNDAELALVVLGFLALIPWIDILYVLIAALVGALIIVGSTWLHDAFDTFDWDELTCIIYASTMDTGFISDTGLAAIKAQITADLDTDPGSVLNDILNIVGRGGMNDAAALRAETGDCNACPTGWSHTLYADSPELNWWFMTRETMYCNHTYAWGNQYLGVTASNGAGHLRWNPTPRAGNGYSIRLAGSVLIPAGSTLTSIIWNYTIGGNNLDGFIKWRKVNATEQCWGQFYTGFNSWTGSLSDQLVEWLIDWLNISTTNGWSVRVDSIAFSGTGIDPFL